MSEVFSSALDYIARGWPVFPLHGIVAGHCMYGRPDCSSPGKHPLTRKGFRHASADRDQVNKWLGRWPSANIGLVTGEPSDIVVIDIDLGRRANTAFDFLDHLIHKLPSTLTALTGGGGLHLIYRRVRALRCTSARVPGISGHLPGVDVRADGGYIVAPPSLHVSGNRYSWLDATRAVTNLPDWIRELPRRPVTLPPAARFDGDGTPYGLAALRGILDELATAPVGCRNHTLYRLARRVSDLVAAGHLDPVSAKSQLEHAALSIGLTQWETTRTMESAFGCAIGRFDPKDARRR